MIMIKSIKVMLIPNNKQKTKMFQYVGASRFAYNWALSRQQENYKNGGKFKNIPKEDEFPVVIYFDYHSTCYDTLEWISIKGEPNG